MIKNLKKRFVISAMVAITILLVVLLGAINILNVVISVNQSERTIEFLAQRSFMPPKDKPGFVPEQKDFFGKPMDEDTAMSARHFTVALNNNDIVFVDVSQISSVDESEAKEICQDVINKKRFSGYTKHFKYLTVAIDSNAPVKNNQIIIFLDMSNTYQNIISVAFVSFVLGVVAWILMLLLVVILSQKAIKPIAENIENQKQFITNAGHEIKTPLAIISANAEVLELHNGKNKWIDNIKSQTNRLNDLMQNLLSLSKAEEGIPKSSIEQDLPQVNAKETLEKVCCSYTELAALEEKTINLSAQDLYTGSLSEENLYRLFNILIENSVKYSSCNSVINVSLFISNNKSVLKVSNNCNALPEVEPNKLFDRFYRGDTSRTQKSGGYGIGLSVAKAIVESVDGEIYASYFDNNLIEFTVEL